MTLFRGCVLKYMGYFGSLVFGKEFLVLKNETIINKNMRVCRSETSFYFIYKYRLIKYFIDYRYDTQFMFNRYICYI